MSAGRPHNSKTPLWKNKAAIKVRIYRWMRLHDDMEESRSECARMMEISRTTVIKWWDTMMWTKEADNAFHEVQHWYNTHWENLDYEQASKELRRHIDEVLLDVATYEEMRGKYIWF